MESARSLTDDELSRLLLRTSRTFALAIPCLPQPLHRQVGTAYLLFRIIDTVEDGDLIDGFQKSRMLHQFAETLNTPPPAGALAERLSEFCQVRPSRDEDEWLLHGRSPSVVATACEFEPGARQVILSAVRRCAAGMRRFVIAGGEHGSVRLQSGPQLHEYCFCVAGLVGEMLTQLFLEEDRVLDAVADQLMIHASAFGEALQLVNILRDSDSDGRQHRQFIPPGASRDELMLVASRDLDRAEYYIDLLKTQSASAGVIQFTEIPVRLARATLHEIERHGPGARVSRSAVMEILADVTQRETSARDVSSVAAGRSA